MKLGEELSQESRNQLVHKHNVTNASGGGAYIIDVQEGNIVKANRFGYVTRAAHGTTMLTHEQQRRVYSQVWVDLSEPRWVFLNTLFSLSESCIYGQLVDLKDRGLLPGDPGYGELYRTVNDSINAAHLEGQLKADIIDDPARFVDLRSTSGLAFIV